MTLLDDLSIGLRVAGSGTWHDDLKGAHESLKIARRPMQLSTIGASLKPEQLPSGRDAQLKPGASYRVRLGSQQLIGTMLVERGAEQATKPIPLTLIEGSDNGRALSMRSEYQVAAEPGSGDSDLSSLAQIFSDTDMVWRINGSTAAGPGLFTEGVINTNMKAIDQVVLVRDFFAPAYAWVDRTGRGVVADLAHLSSSTAAVLNEDDYSQLVTGYDMETCINSVTVQRITGEEFGPYVDADSIEEWGERPVTLKIRNDDPFGVTPEDQAQKFLDLNKDPVFQVLSVRIPLHRINSSTIAQLDLYDKVVVQNTARSINQTLRVTSIEHEIKPLRSGSTWIMTLGFSVEGIAAIPQVLPEMPSE